MARRLKQTAIVFVVVFAAAQLVRPERANPPTDQSRTIQAHMGTASGVVAVLDRSCRDCHSNGTVWPWYAHVAPASWLMAYGVREGRKAVNFSEWAGYPPGLYTLLRPETKLSRQDVDTICAAARQTDMSR
jgi:Haem-binding domain